MKHLSDYSRKLNTKTSCTNWLLLKFLKESLKKKGQNWCVNRDFIGVVLVQEIGRLYTFVSNLISKAELCSLADVALVLSMQSAISALFSSLFPLSKSVSHLVAWRLVEYFSTGWNKSIASLSSLLCWSEFWWEEGEGFCFTIFFRFRAWKTGLPLSDLLEVIFTIWCFSRHFWNVVTW